MSDLRERVARAIFVVNSGEGTTWGSAHAAVRAQCYRMAGAALAEMSGARADAPDWEGFGRDLLEGWPVGDVDGSELFDAALRNGLIREIPGGYDPDQHIDAEGICPEVGDPWYEYAFRDIAEGKDHE